MNTGPSSLQALKACKISNYSTVYLRSETMTKLLQFKALIEPGVSVDTAAGRYCCPKKKLMVGDDR